MAGSEHEEWVREMRERMIEVLQEGRDVTYLLTLYTTIRMGRLSRQQQGLVQTLSDCGPLPVNRLGRQCRVTPSVASSQLRRLVAEGYIRGERAATDSRVVFYALADPVLREGLFLASRPCDWTPVSLVSALWEACPDLRRTVDPPAQVAESDVVGVKL